MEDECIDALVIDYFSPIVFYDTEPLQSYWQLVQEDLYPQFFKALKTGRRSDFFNVFYAAEAVLDMMKDDGLPYNSPAWDRAVAIYWESSKFLITMEKFQMKFYVEENWDQKPH